jgi:hypothetical protein
VLVKSPPIKQAEPVERSAPPPVQNKALPQARPRALYVVQALSYLALCLAGLESVFYLAHVGDSEYLKPDLTMGYKPMEGKQVTQRHEGFGRFVFNQFGMQNDEISVAKPPGVFRIALLGDSYVESLQVDRQANYCSLLAKDLTERLGRRVEVLNFGVANYSIAQDYLRYQNLAKNFAPDLVIQGFRVEEVVKLLPEPTIKLASVRPVLFPGADGNLIYDNLCVRNYLSSAEGKRMQKTYWLRRNSRIWGVIGGMVQTISAAKIAVPDAAPAAAAPVDAQVGKGAPATSGASATAGAPGHGPADPFGTAGATAKDIQLVRAKYTKCYWYLMDAQLRALVKACRANNSKVLIIRTPSGNINPTETELLQASATRLGVNVFNIDQKFKQQFTAADDSTYFLSHGHFSKPMHRWLENELADYLVSHRSLLQAATPAPQTEGAVSK